MDKEINPIANCSYTGKNCIIPEYIQNSHVVELLIDIACYALTCPRVGNIFEPIPETWKLANISAENAITHFNLCTDSQKIILDIASSNSDEELIAKIGENTYGFIKLYCKKKEMKELEEQVDLLLPDFLRLFVNACYGFIKLDYAKAEKKKRFCCF
jgi:hypothetical protein